MGGSAGSAGSAGGAAPTPPAEAGSWRPEGAIPLSARTRAALDPGGRIWITELDPRQVHPKIGPAAEKLKPGLAGGTELVSWELAFGRVTSRYPCRPRKGGGCDKEIERRLAYVAAAWLYGPEPPHSVPCCPNPKEVEPPRTIRWLSWAIFDAATGKMLRGGTA